jgi:hypothetical protein
METPTYTLEIIDDGTLDTVVLCRAVKVGSLGSHPVHGDLRSRTFRYCSDYRFSFENDAAFLDAIREEVEDEVEELITAKGMG